jgi:hypothetical protein
MTDAPADRSDARMEALRHALQTAKAAGMTFKSFRELANKRHPDRTLSRQRFAEFIAKNSTAKLSVENFNFLAETWLDAPFGRAFRHLNSRPGDRPFDDIIDLLTGSARTQPAGLRAAGRYYVYHGSYMEPARYVIRAIEISEGDGALLAVSDTIREKFTGRTPSVAYGAMMFVSEQPQILLYGRENKRGLSLMLGQDPLPTPAGMVQSIAGLLFVMTSRTQIAQRRFLMERKENQSLAQMVGETGVFTWPEIEHNKRHETAFRRLQNEITLKEAFPDPLLTPIP